MSINIEKTIQQVKGKGKNTIITVLNKLSNEKGLVGHSRWSHDETKELLNSLRQVKEEWEIANANYEFVDEAELIDYYTYLIKASQIKYNYLIKKLKEKGPKIELDNSYELKLSNNEDIQNNLE